MCEEAGRPFRCQAGEPCIPQSPENRRALRFAGRVRALGPFLAWQLTRLAIPAEELPGFELRLMKIAELAGGTLSRAAL